MTERQILPLMARMIDGLAQLISLDIPFLLAERNDRVLRLRDLLTRPDVSTSEKYRNVLNAFQIENEYGRTIKSYSTTIMLQDVETQVNMLQIGRVALLYQSLDEQRQGMWDKKTSTWQPLDSSYRIAIRQGIRIARKQIAPDLIKLPIFTPEKNTGDQR